MSAVQTRRQFKRNVTTPPDVAAWAGAPVLFMVACDCGPFLDHAIAFARSLDVFAPGHHLLLHLINPRHEHVDHARYVARTLANVKVHISTEQTQVDPELKHAYYASARFLQLADLFSAGNQVPVFVLDADTLAVAPVSLDFSDKPEAEICLRRRDLTGPVEEHLSVAAGAVWATPTEPARAFVAAVANDLHKSFDEGTATWFVDQATLAHHVALSTGEAAVRNLKTKFCDWDFRDDTIFWSGKGTRKHDDLRYLIVRDAFDEDPVARNSARQMLAIACARSGEHGATTAIGRVRRILATQRGKRAAILLPRLDMPWKPAALKAFGAIPAQAEDTISLRLWWKRFAMELARILESHGVEVRLVELPAWHITAERVDREDVDLAFIPHRCSIDFIPGRTPCIFFMQEYFRSVFVVDEGGWSAASTVYPVDAATLPPAVLGVWDRYRKAFVDRTLDSKFGQSARQPRSRLVETGNLPAEPYVFFPLQIPHDQSIRYFSDIKQDQALEAALRAASTVGRVLLLKEHPANRATAKQYRERFGSRVRWTDAHVHDVLDYADAIVTINSGVGFEALLADRPVVCLGRVEYDAAAHQASLETLGAVLGEAIDEPAESRTRRYARFVDWFLGRHAVDLSAPQLARHILEGIVSSALRRIDSVTTGEA